MRLYIYAAIALALAGLLWHDHYQTQRANREAKRANVAEATVIAERENTRKANEAAQRYQARADGLEADRRSNPLPAVIVGRVCRSAARMPAAADPASSHEAVEGHDARADAEDSDAGRDIGPQLDDFATDAEENLIQCQELQRLVGKPSPSRR